VIEQGPDSFGAHVTDLPGCVAAAESREEVLQLIREAINLHLETLRESGEPIPEPASQTEYVEV
jgi:predicted RNase H-like HicB family nuclease